MKNLSDLSKKPSKKDVQLAKTLIILGKLTEYAVENCQVNPYTVPEIKNACQLIAENKCFTHWLFWNT